MKPQLPEGPGGRRVAAGLVLLAALKAAGLILIADALATGIAQLAGGGTLSVRRLLVVGITGALARALAVWATALLSRRAGLGAKEQLRGRLLKSGLEGQPGVAGKLGHGALSALASRGLDALDEYYTKYLPALFAAAVIPLMLLVRILVADWVSALILTLTLPLVPAFMILIGLHTQDRVRVAAVGLDRLANQLMELAQGLPALIGLRRAGAKGRALERVTEDYRRATMGTLRTAFVSGLALELIATISVAVLAVFIGVRLVHGGMGLEAGLLALMLAPECFSPLRELGSAYHSAEDGSEALRRTREILASRETGETGENDELAPMDGIAVRAQGLRIGYRARPDVVVTEATFTLDVGGVLVLDAASGTGKSTLLNAVAGVLEHRGPDAEAVLTGMLRTGADTVGWISQHPAFSQDTAEDELRLHAGRRVDGAEVLAVLGSVNAGHLIGARLSDASPGELRRIAVARALLHLKDAPGPRLLVADEPTAHLDPVSAEAVRTALAALRGDTALLVASHDPVLAALLRRGEPASIVPATSTATSTSTTAHASATHPAPGTFSSTAAGDRTPAAGARSHWRMLRTLPWTGRQGMAVGIVLAALAALAAVGLTGVSGWLIVSASHQPPIMHLLVAIVAVRAFGIGRSVLRYAERLAVHDAVLRWAGTLRTRIWDALSTRPEHWGRMTRSGAALGRLVAEVDEVRDTVPRVLVPPASALLSWAAVSVGIGFWAPGALGVSIGLGVLAFVLLPPLVLAVEQRHSVELSAHRIALGERIPTILRASADLGAHGAVDRATGEFTAADARASTVLRRSARGAGLGQGASVLLCSLAAVAAVVAVGATGGSGEMAAVAGLLLLAMAEPLADAAVSASLVPQLDDGLRRIESSLGTGTAGIRAAAESVATAGRPGTAAAAPMGLRLQGVTLGWGRGNDVLSGIDARVLPGHWLAVTGPSGSGKSTLLAAMLGALAPRAGTLSVGDGGGWRRMSAGDAARIAWCPQEAHLFDSSVRRNLGLGREEADQPSDAELSEVLGAIGLGDWLASSPEGLDTRIGSGGHRLSGGQRQRLAVARALLARADVLLLDEPTAHLGQDESVELITDLRRALAGKAVVLVTHDRRLEAHADSVLRLDAAPRDTSPEWWGAAVRGTPVAAGAAAR
ncbi:thiol reductant ABC exporter subunit CydC [Paeniglutamicibacter cryotolerans]|uniref:ATP-binding cassette subfamily C protein CydCD n=1 Tax=Paeniglutamicibacter cryotolerans TaxID=670079 RepID=A0A839QLE3_9MICC|nr:thiol reductant ABC exporter subunit CydC [Paeniglutamicibacter cryotolerans]MBB2996677.1 ATP-binding cassette subfamily C protein CydCD [Paeniglutamicibacter cryotolerans]